MVKVDIASNVIEIEPGTSKELALTVTNQSTILDLYTVAIQPIFTPETAGLDVGWLQVDAPQFSLRPPVPGSQTVTDESRRRLTLVLTIPPNVQAGTYTGQLNVIAESGSENSSSMPFTIVVAEVEKQTLTLHPPEQTHNKKRAIYKVVVTNDGNAPLLIPLYAEDRADAVKLELIPTEVRLEPMQQASVTLRVQPYRRNWAKPTKEYAFAIKADDFPLEATGLFRQDPALPILGWIGRHVWQTVLLLLALIALVIGLSVWLFPWLLVPPAPFGCVPNSNREVFVSSNDFNTSIFVQSAVPGQPAVEVATIPSSQMPGIFASMVSVSPDGRRLAYVTANNLRLERATLNIYNIDERRILATVTVSGTMGTMWTAAPIWSADGERVVYLTRPSAPGSAPEGSSGAPSIPTPIPSPTIVLTGTVAGLPTATPTTAQNINTATAVAASRNFNPRRLDAWVWEINVNNSQNALPRPLAPQGILDLDVDRYYGDGALPQNRPLCWNIDNQHVIAKVRPSTDPARKVYDVMYTLKGEPKILGPTPLPFIVPSVLPGPPTINVGTPAPISPVVPRLQRIEPVDGGGKAGQMAILPSQVTTSTVNQNLPQLCGIKQPLSMNDPDWVNRPILAGDSSRRIGDFGCPIVAATMMLNAAGTAKAETPETLASCLDSANQPDSRLMPLTEDGWKAITELCGNGQLGGGERIDFSWSRLTEKLNEGPVIVGLLGKPTGTHFVIVTGGQDQKADTYTVIDPWDGSTYKTLQNFLDWGYGLRWMIDFQFGGGACGVSPRIPAATPLKIVTTGIEDGGLYSTTQRLTIETSGAKEAVKLTTDIRRTPPNQQPGRFEPRTVENDSQIEFEQEGSYEVLITAVSGPLRAERTMYFVVDKSAPDVNISFSPLSSNRVFSNTIVNIDFNASDPTSSIGSIEYELAVLSLGRVLPIARYTSDTGTRQLTINRAGTFIIRYRSINGAGIASPFKEEQFIIQAPSNVAAGASAAGGLPNTGSQTGGATTGTVGRPNAPTGQGGGNPIPPGQVVANPGNAAPPTLTPVRNVPVAPVATPRPTFTPVPTLAATTTVAGTPLLPTATVSPFPATAAFSPTPITTAAPITPTATVSPTVVAAPKLVLNTTNIVFNANETVQELTLTNTGGAGLIWSLQPGLSETLLEFNNLGAVLEAGQSVKIRINLRAAAFTTNETNTSFRVSGGGVNFDINVVIRPRASATADFAPLASPVLTPEVGIKVIISNQNGTVLPDFVIITGTFQSCASCPVSTVRLTDSLGRNLEPSPANNWTVVWNTANFPPQENISLSGAACKNPANPVCTPLPTSLTGLRILLAANVASPVASTVLNTIASSNSIIQLAIPEPSGNRAKKARIFVTYDDNGVSTTLPTLETNAAIGWQVTLDTNQIKPDTVMQSIPVTITGQICDGEVSSSICVDIPPVTKLVTKLLANITGTDVSSPTSSNFKFDNGINLPEKFILNAQTSANISSVTAYLTLKDYGPGGTLTDVTKVFVFSSPGFTASVTTYQYPPQNAVRLVVTACYRGGTPCDNVAQYNNLVIAVRPATQIIATAETKDANLVTPANVGEPFSTPLIARVLDSNNIGVAGVLVTFTLPTDPIAPSGLFYVGNPLSPSFTSTTYVTVTNQNGLARAINIKANDQPGQWEARANTGGVGTAALFALRNTRPGTPRVDIVSGNGQKAQIQATFGQELQVILRDNLGNPQAGVDVYFLADANAPGVVFTTNGSNNITATTNVNGIARSGTFVANRYVGQFLVSANAVGYDSGQFRLENLPGRPFKIVPVTALSVSGKISTTLSPFFQVTVEDNALPPTKLQGIDVAFTSPVAAPGQPSGSFNNGGTPAKSVTIRTLADGSATSLPFILNEKASTTQHLVNVTVVTQTIPAVPSINFSIVNLPGDPVRVEIAPPGSQTYEAGENRANSFTGQAFDIGNNPVNNAAIQFAARTGGTGAPTGLWGGASIVTRTTDAAGNPVDAGAFVAACPPANNYQVDVTAPGFPAVATKTYNVTIVPGPARVISPTTPALAAIANQNFNSPLGALVTDGCASSPNPVSGVSVLFQLNNGTSGGTFVPSGFVTETAATNASGVASTSQIKANTVKGSFTATASVIPTNTINTSGYTLNINPAAPSSVITSQTVVSLTAPVSTTHNTDTTTLVRVEDQFGNRVNAGVPVTFTITTGTNGASGRFPGNATTFSTVTDAQGEARMQDILANTSAGDFDVQVRAGAIATVYLFHLTNIPGNVYRIEVVSLNGDTTLPFSRTVNTNIQLEIRTFDFSGNRAQGVTVNYSSPATGAGLNPRNGSFVTSTGGNPNNRGEYQGTFQVNTTSNTWNGTGFDTYNITFSAAAGAVVTNVTFINFPDDPNKLVFISPNPNIGNSATPVEGRAGEVFTNVRFAIQDFFNNPIPNATVSFNVGSNGGATLNPNTITSQNINNANGQVTVTNMIANGTVSISPYNIDVNVTSPYGNANPVGRFYLRNNAGLPVSVVANPAGPLATTVGTNFNSGNPIQFTVRDRFNNTVANEPVTLTVGTGTPPGSSAATPASGTVITTTGAGVASVVVQANNIPGTYNLSAAAGVTATDTVALQNTVGAANNIIITPTTSAASRAQATISDDFNNGVGFVITVRDTLNNPVPGQNVTFNVPGTGASITNTLGAGLTNASGQYTTPVLYANNTAGTFQVGVTSGAANAQIFMQNVLPAITKTGGDNQNALVGAQFGQPLAVNVTGAGGSPVPNGTTVRYTVTAGNALMPGGVTTYNTTTTAGNASTVITAGTSVSAATYNVTAEVIVGGSPVATTTFALSNRVTLAIVSGNTQSRITGQTFAPLVVQANGATSGINNIRIRYSVVSATDGNFGGPTAVTQISAGAGQTSASNLVAGTNINNFTVTARVVDAADNPIAGMTAVTFNLTNLTFSLNLISGDNQDAIFNGGTAPVGFRVQVVRSDAVNLSAIPVTYTANTPARGSFGSVGGSSTFITNTDTNGFAENNVSVVAQRFFANNQRGAHTVTAQVTIGSVVRTVTFDIQNNARIVAVSGSTNIAVTQNITDVVTFPVSVTVNVEDFAGNNIGNETVTYTLSGTGSARFVDRTLSTTTGTVTGVTANGAPNNGTYNSTTFRYETLAGAATYTLTVSGTNARSLIFNITQS